MSEALCTVYEREVSNYHKTATTTILLAEFGKDVYEEHAGEWMIESDGRVSRRQDVAGQPSR